MEQVEQQNQKVTGDMTIGDVVKKYPAAAEVMLSYGLHCIGCHVNPYETIEQGCTAHGMTSEVIAEMLGKVNAAISAPVSAEIQVTEAAAKKIIELATSEKKEGQALRVKVVPGGCSGFNYDMHFDEKVHPEDKTFENHGSKIIVDGGSLEFLKGTTIDFVDSLQGSGFKLQNPNAKSTCGCGNSAGF